MQLRSHLLPRNRFDLTGVDLADAPFDLFSPCCFDVGLWFGFEALQQGGGELCSFVLGELRGLAIQILECSTHLRNCTSAGWARSSTGTSAVRVRYECRVAGSGLHSGVGPGYVFHTDALHAHI